MRKIALLCAAGALAACSAAGDEQARAPEPKNEAAETASAESVAGRYNVVRADGSGFISVINADGTYSEEVDGATSVTGRWKAEGERTCYDPDGEAERMCYTFGAPAEPAEEGTFTATSEAGDVLTVRRIDG